MTGADFIRDVRELCSDTLEGSSTSNYMFETDEIASSAATVRELLVKLLYSQRRSVTQPYNLTINRMVKEAPATSSIPVDFWKLLCGKGPNGYVPAQTDQDSEPYLLSGDDIITIRAGAFAGTATTAVYVALPSSPINDDPTPFTDFPDAFYETLELMTCADLLLKHERGVVDQNIFLRRELASAMASLT